MSTIYHLVPRSVWESQPAGDYAADSLATEGFIHCSFENQVARVANLFFAGSDAMVVLCIDVDRLTSPLREEDPGVGEVFPHVYGPIARASIAAVRELRRDSAGRWVFP